MLTIQWLGELWRKHHQVFTLLDAQRRVVIALDMLIERPELTDQAVRAGIDLLVVDKAQRLRRPPGHPGEPGWRAIAPIAGIGRHVLLLSATPLEDDAHGFFRLLQLLRPQEFPEDVSFEARLSLATPLPPCSSSTRRADIGGLPPRVGVPITLDNPSKWQPRNAVEAAVRAMTVPDGQTRPDSAAAIRQRPLHAHPVTNDANEDVDWPGLVRRLGTQLDATRRPHALAAIMVRPGLPERGRAEN